MTSDLTELLARVEAAEGPDRQLDERIWAEFDGRDVREHDKMLLARSRKPPHDECIIGWIDPGKRARNFTPYHSGPLFTASLDATLALCERVMPGFDWIIGHTNGGLTIHAQLGSGPQVFGETPPLALLAALLKAKIAQTEPTP